MIAPPANVGTGSAPKPRHGEKYLIVTADDFGAAKEVNDAVERGHREGILTAASLMVGAPAAADAVERAKAMPRLGVGLHVVLVEGRPVLPAAQVPALVDAAGNFRPDMVRLSFEIALLPTVRRQLAAEIEAQFEAFAATGLKLDHVNAHKHFHLHPMIAGLIVRIGARFGMKALRVPYEPPAVVRAIEPGASGGNIERMWARRLRARLKAQGLFAPDQVFGLRWSGAMTTERVAGLLSHLPDGVSEIYMHPATGSYPGSTQGYHYKTELDSLISQQAADIISHRGILTGPFADFSASALAPVAALHQMQSAI